MGWHDLRWRELHGCSYWKPNQKSILVPISFGTSITTTPNHNNLFCTFKVPQKTDFFFYHNSENKMYNINSPEIPKFEHFSFFGWLLHCENEGKKWCKQRCRVKSNEPNRQWRSRRLQTGSCLWFQNDADTVDKVDGDDFFFSVLA